MIYLDWTLLVEIAFFLFLFFMLKKMLFRPLLELVEQRRRAIEDREKVAKAWRTEAEEKLAVYKDKIDKAASEAEGIKSSILREARDKQREIVMNAHRQAEEFIASQVGSAKVKAEDIKKELEQKVSKIAQDIVGRLVL